ncbi:DUF4817 domain-containing protein [Trichonephila clavipes]|nr:DUF4817 domain-containing protein [Trichonephila clavipes]
MKAHLAYQKSGSSTARYKIAEFADMHLTYGAFDSNGQAAKRYLRDQTPSHAFLALLHKRLSDSRPFVLDTQESEPRVGIPNNEESVLDLVQNNPDTSVRRILRRRAFLPLVWCGS